MTSSLPSGDGISTGTGPSSALDEDALPATGNEPDTARTAAGEGQVSAAPDVSVAPETAPSTGSRAVGDSDARDSDSGDSDSGDSAARDSALGDSDTPTGTDTPRGSGAPVDSDAPGDSGRPDASAAAAPAAPSAEGPHPGDGSTAQGAVEGLDPARAQDEVNPGSHRDVVEHVELDGPALENSEMRKGTEDLQASLDATAEARGLAADVRKQTLPGTSPTGL